jgi:hypothetical protein
MMMRNCRRKEMIPIQATMMEIVETAVEMAAMEGIKASLPYFEYERKSTTIDILYLCDNCIIRI